MGKLTRGARRGARAAVIAGVVLGGLIAAARPGRAEGPTAADRLFGRDNLVAWCVVPFDSKKRGPEDRAEMLERLGFKRFAYDWRAEHVPTFDAELDALKRHGIKVQAFWAPGELNGDSRRILDVLARHKVETELWVMLDLGADLVSGPEQERRVELAAAKLKPLAEEAGKIGCSLALYNHEGWFGEPENQIAIIEGLRKEGVSNVGMAYNLHHGHAHLDRLPALLSKMKPYLKAVSHHGMDKGGDRVGRKILPIGQGECDLALLKTILDSGYAGPIGILGHTSDDAEARLRDNLDGLDWLVPQLDGRPAGRARRPGRPSLRAPSETEKAESTPVSPEEAATVARVIREARAGGDPRRGAGVFASAKAACLSCHKVGDQGGTVGPDLSTAGLCVPAEEVVAAVLWPKRKVKPGYEAVTVATADGKVLQGFHEADDGKSIGLRDPATGTITRINKADVETVRDDGTLMPEGLAESLSAEDRRDLFRFLLDLGRPGGTAAGDLPAHAHAPAVFAFDRAPIRPGDWPSWQEPVNRDRLYDYYAKEAEAFVGKAAPALLPPYPGLDGGKLGHWGNQNEQVWADDRWNQTDVGTLLAGIFRGAGVTVPKGVCVRLGERGEMAACFNPETLCYEALWKGGFVKFSGVRHGFMDGLILDGKPKPRPAGTKPDAPFVYHGFYRHGKRVVFAYRVGDVEMLDAPWVEDGAFTRVVGPAAGHPLAALTKGGPVQWPETFATKGTLGDGSPYAVDTVGLPTPNPWNAMPFFGGHDFLPDGSALLCTMQGDVWRVEGLDESLANVKWRRFASGLHQALGLVVAEGSVYVLGRDQITRLRDLNGDGEADFYECFSNAYITSTAGHDFICGHGAWRRIGPVL